MTSMLDQLFPGTEHVERVTGYGRGLNSNLTENAAGGGHLAREEISTRWAMIYALEVRGLDKKDIAERLNLSYGAVIHATNDERYIAYREQHLQALDQDFVTMKPLAFDALRNGLRSQDENVALRASEQWFKAANFGGFSKHEAPAQAATATDVARALLQQVNVNVTVTNIPTSTPTPSSDEPVE